MDYVRTGDLEVLFEQRKVKYGWTKVDLEHTDLEFEACLDGQK